MAAGALITGAAAAATVVSEGFDGFDTGTRPSGWVFTGCDQNSDTYTTAGNYGAASPSIKLDATGDAITTDTFVNPSAASMVLSVWLRGMATNESSNLAIDEYFGGGWSSVTDIHGLPLTGTVIGDLDLNASTTQVRFTYNKDAGNLGLDDVLIETGATTVSTTTGTTTIVTTTIVTTSATIEHFVIDYDDYTGDGFTDAAVFDAGSFYVENVGTISMGSAGDIPASGDFNGDGTADATVYSGGTWIINGLTNITFGSAGQIPVPADYNGDGTTDAATYSPTFGMWYIRGITEVQYGGNAADVPVPGDYNGDGTADRALYRWTVAEQGKWYIDGMEVVSWGGISTDLPVPMDYDGDGTTDTMIVRDYGTHYRWLLPGGAYPTWGIPSVDTPLTGDITGDGASDLVIWRPHKTRWFASPSIGGVERFNYGPTQGTAAIGASY